MQKKILVIEDEAAIRDMIAFALEAEGFQVTGVENGQDARQAIADSIPDLMLVDWFSPLSRHTYSTYHHADRAQRRK